LPPRPCSVHRVQTVSSTDARVPSSEEPGAASAVGIVSPSPSQLVERRSQPSPPIRRSAQPRRPGWVGRPCPTRNASLTRTNPHEEPRPNGLDTKDPADASRRAASRWTIGKALGSPRHVGTGRRMTALEHPMRYLLRYGRSPTNRAVFRLSGGPAARTSWAIVIAGPEYSSSCAEDVTEVPWPSTSGS
jgi:hypothetical protein